MIYISFNFNVVHTLIISMAIFSMNFIPLNGTQLTHKTNLAGTLWNIIHIHVFPLIYYTELLYTELFSFITFYAPLEELPSITMPWMIITFTSLSSQNSKFSFMFTWLLLTELKSRLDFLKLNEWLSYSNLFDGKVSEIQECIKKPCVMHACFINDVEFLLFLRWLAYDSVRALVESCAVL